MHTLVKASVCTAASIAIFQLIACTNPSTLTSYYGGDQGTSCSGTHGTGQTAFESVVLHSNGGMYGANWDLPNTGPAITTQSGSHFLNSVISTIAASPDSGKQQITQAEQVWSNTLPFFALANRTSQVLAADGNIHPMTNDPLRIGQQWVWYQCDDSVQLDQFTDDGVAYASAKITDIKTLPLTGTVLLNSLPAEAKNANFIGFINTANGGAGNPALVSLTPQSYLPNAKFLVYKTTALTDTYKLKACAVSGLSCGALGSQTFTQMLTTMGINTSTGAFSTAYGQNVWIETAITPSDIAGQSTDLHNFYLEQGGNVFKGQMIKAGTLVWDDEAYSHAAGGTQAGSEWHRKPNKEAALGIKSALAF